MSALAQYLDELRVNAFYTSLKSEVLKVLNRVPLLGDPVERFLAQMKESIKAGLHGGMLFESLGFRYIGPVDGHNIGQLCKYLAMVKDVEGPVLLHVVTEKGHGFEPAAADPVVFLEAKKDGVRFRPASDTLEVDALVILRPPLDPTGLAEALAAAMRHAGKPYAAAKGGRAPLSKSRAGTP